MKKCLIGFLVGIVLSVSGTTYAADITSLIGKTVQGVFPIKVNGDVLPQTAIVIDGTSYLPVRAIGDAIGYDVSFNADLGVELKKKGVMSMSTVTPSTTTASVVAPSVTNTVYDLQTIDFNIRRLNNFSIDLNENIKEYSDSPKLAEWQVQLKSYQDEQAIWEARKAALPPTP